MLLSDSPYSKLGSRPNRVSLSEFHDIALHGSRHSCRCEAIGDSRAQNRGAVLVSHRSHRATGTAQFIEDNLGVITSKEHLFCTSVSVREWGINNFIEDMTQQSWQFHSNAPCCCPENCSKATPETKTPENAQLLSFHRAEY
jgi:hypothetical protein